MKWKLVIFIRDPAGPQVKTRIARELGSAKATAIYRQLLTILCRNLKGLHPVQVRHTPDELSEEGRNLFPAEWQLAPQGDGDLGQRLNHAFESELANDTDSLIIIGSDCPYVTRKHIMDAVAELRSRDIVVGPAADGGYWLIGLNKPRPELFEDISWSSDEVLTQTLAKAKTAGLRIGLMEILSDIDTAKDWLIFLEENK